MTETNGSRVLVIIPAFNEEQSIGTVIRQVREYGFEDIVVIDDGSLDNTTSVARSCGVTVLTLPFNTGIGGAVSLGLSWACGQGYEVVLRVDADGQHDASCARAVLEPVLCGGVQLCIGSRFMGSLDQGYRSSFVRRIGIGFFSRLITLLTGRRVTDPTSGFNAFGPQAVALFAGYYPADYPEPEAIVIAARAGLTVQEVPVKMRPRSAGNSSIRYLRTLYYMINVTLAIMLNYLRPAKNVQGD